MQELLWARNYLPFHSTRRKCKRMHERSGKQFKTESDNLQAIPLKSPRNEPTFLKRIHWPHFGWLSVNFNGLYLIRFLKQSYYQINQIRSWASTDSIRNKPRPFKTLSYHQLFGQRLHNLLTKQTHSFIPHPWVCCLEGSWNRSNLSIPLKIFYRGTLLCDPKI